MGSTFYGIDIIDVTVNILSKGGVVQDGNFDRNLTLLGGDINHFIDQALARLIDKLNKLLQTSFGMELLCFVLAILILLSFVGQEDLDAFVQERELAQHFRPVWNI